MPEWYSTGKYASERHWHDDSHTKHIRKQCKNPQALWTLPLAGDWDIDMLSRQKVFMRVMLTKNVNVKERFANGTQGYILRWQPCSVGSRKRSKYIVAVDEQSLAVTFVKKSSLDSGKSVLFEEFDKIELKPVPERLSGKHGNSVVEQIPVLPAYALTIHKCQSLTISHTVKLCLEGIFAHGSAYVSCSRSTDPANLVCVGLPPKDLLDDVAECWRARRLNVHDCMEAAVTVTDEWEYDRSLGPADGTSSAAAVDVFSRLKRKYKRGRTVPVQLRTLEQILKPQQQMADVMGRFLSWVGRENEAVRAGEPPPAFETETGGPIFPNAGECEWWLTDVQQRRPPEEQKNTAKTQATHFENPDFSDSDAERGTSEHGGLDDDGGAVGDGVGSDGGLRDGFSDSSSDESCKEPTYGHAAFGNAPRAGGAECPPLLEAPVLAAFGRARVARKAFQTALY